MSIQRRSSACSQEAPCLAPGRVVHQEGGATCVAPACDWSRDGVSGLGLEEGARVWVLIGARNQQKNPQTPKQKS